jgi:hypothetical protein
MNLRHLFFLLQRALEGRNIKNNKYFLGLRSLVYKVTSINSEREREKKSSARSFRQTGLLSLAILSTNEKGSYFFYLPFGESWTAG